MEGAVESFVKGPNRMIDVQWCPANKKLDDQNNQKF